MMKTLLSASLLFYASLLSFAQAPTISNVTFLAPGSRLITHVDSVTVFPSNAGPSQNWDYTFLRGLMSDTIELISPVGTPSYAKYPNSTSAIYFKDGGYIYFTSNTGGLWQNNNTISYTIRDASNVEGHYQFDFANSPARKIVQLPFTYQSTWSGSTSGKQSIGGAPLYDSVRYSTSTNYAVLCDAWGSLKTPTGDYGSSLRVKLTAISQVMLETKSKGTWSNYHSRTEHDTSYTWYVPNLNTPVLDLYQKGKGAYFASFHGDLLTSLLDEHFAKAQLLAYPNPAREEFFVRGAQQLLKLSHASGKEIGFKAIETPEGVLVHLQESAPGMYLATVKQGNATKTLKIAVVE